MRISFRLDRSTKELMKKFQYEVLSIEGKLIPQGLLVRKAIEIIQPHINKIDWTMDRYYNRIKVRDGIVTTLNIDEYSLSILKEIKSNIDLQARIFPAELVRLVFIEALKMEGKQFCLKER